MTADDELTEAIARALAYDCEGTGVDVPDPGYDLWCVTHDSGIPSGEWCHDIAYAADRILPIVRAQQAEAWDECADEAFSLGHLHGPACTEMTNRNPYREQEADQ